MYEIITNASHKIITNASHKIIVAGQEPCADCSNTPKYIDVTFSGWSDCSSYCHNYLSGVNGMVNCNPPPDEITPGIDFKISGIAAAINGNTYRLTVANPAGPPGSEGDACTAYGEVSGINGQIEWWWPGNGSCNGGHECLLSHETETNLTLYMGLVLLNYADAGNTAYTYPAVAWIGKTITISNNDVTPTYYTYNLGTYIICDLIKYFSGEDGYDCGRADAQSAGCDSGDCTPASPLITLGIIKTIYGGNIALTPAY